MIVALLRISRVPHLTVRGHRVRAIQQVLNARF
jgi:hypothetical protein